MNKYAEYQRRYYLEHKEKRLQTTKKSYIRRKFGIEPEEYERLMKDAQCAICTGTHLLRLDHCHETGQIRGILCHGCNVALGHFRDDMKLLDKAKEYLGGATQQLQEVIGVHT